MQKKLAKCGVKTIYFCRFKSKQCFCCKYSTKKKRRYKKRGLSNDT